MKHIDWKNKNWAPYTIATCSAVVLYFLLNNIGWLFKGLGIFVNVLKPVLIGVILAYIVNPLVNLVEKYPLKFIRNRRLARNIAVALGLIIVIIPFIALMIVLILQVVTSIIDFINNIPTYEVNIRNFINSFSSNDHKFNINIDKIDEAFNKGGEIIRSYISKKGSNESGDFSQTAANVGSSISNWAIGFLISIYILADKVRIKSIGKKLVGKIWHDEKYDRAIVILRKCNKILIKFIVCELIDALIVGISNYIFMIILGMHYSILISAVVGITNLAPTFGPIIGGVIGGFILVLDNPWNALWFIIFTIILQTIDGYIIKPKMYGGTLGVPSIWILISIVVGGRAFGIPGIILGIPVAAIISYILNEVIFEKKNDNL